MIETGIDIVEIERIAAAVRRFGDRFLVRVYTETERDQSGGRAESLAARFAAKEAAFKTLGRRFAWRDVEVERDPTGKTRLSFHGDAKEEAERLGLREWSVSLSHSRDNAVAVVVARGGPL